MINDICSLADKQCLPCEGNVPPLCEARANLLLTQLSAHWQLIDDNRKIMKEFKFENFVKALEFVNQVGNIAEAELHHPDIHLVNYKQVLIELTTHAINGLSENDFIVAAKIDQI